MLDPSKESVAGRTAGGAEVRIRLAEAKVADRNRSYSINLDATDQQPWTRSSSPIACTLRILA